MGTRWLAWPGSRIASSNDIAVCVYGVHSQTALSTEPANPLPVGGDKARGVLVGIHRDVKQRNLVATPAAFAGGDQLASPVRDAHRDDIDFLTDDDAAAREGRV